MKLKTSGPLFLFFLFVFTLIIFPVDSKINETHVVFPDGETCAAWYSRKSMIFKPMVGMTGINCKNNIRMEKSGEMFQLVAEMPLEGFDSGSKGRDDFFRKALKEKERAALLFESNPMGKSDWSKIFSGSGKNLSGVLHIGSNQYPVDFSISHSGSTIKGIFTGNYEHFGLKPHVIGPFGMIAKTEDYLEIHFQLNTDMVKPL